MGLLGNLLNMAVSKTSGGGVDQASLSTIMELMNNSDGGIQGVVGKLKSAGLESVVNSWIGTGKNKGISASQITNILGPELIGKIASKLGLSQSGAASKVAMLLPLIIDKLTPDGDASSLGKGINIESILGSLLKK